MLSNPLLCVCKMQGNTGHGGSDWICDCVSVVSGTSWDANYVKVEQ